MHAITEIRGPAAVEVPPRARLEPLDHRGCRLAATVAGTGPPVLFIQGCGVQGDGWRPQTDALSRHFECLWFDHRGLGRSQPAGSPITVERLADDARVLMDARGWSSAHVVGHSLGGLIALHLALECRARVRSLSLLCTFARGRDAAPMTPRMTWIGMRTRVGTRRMRRHAFLELVMPPASLAGADRTALAERLAELFGHDLGEHPPVLGQQLAAMNAYDSTARLGELAGLPALVISAARDPIAPPVAGRRLAGGIPGARYVEFPEASHGLPIERAGEVNARLLEHLRRAEGIGV